jgi:hypothetical protein
MTNSASQSRDQAITTSMEEVERARRIALAGRRALEEAEQRRRLADDPTPPEEIGGRAGLEPTRYGDWEAKGIVSDF